MPSHWLLDLEVTCYPIPWITGYFRQLRQLVRFIGKVIMSGSAGPLHSYGLFALNGLFKYLQEQTLDLPQFPWGVPNFSNDYIVCIVCLGFLSSKILVNLREIAQRNCNLCSRLSCYLSSKTWHSKHLKKWTTFWSPMLKVYLMPKFFLLIRNWQEITQKKGSFSQLSLKKVTLLEEFPSIVLPAVWDFGFFKPWWQALSNRNTGGNKNLTVVSILPWL